MIEAVSILALLAVIALLVWRERQLHDVLRQRDAVIARLIRRVGRAHGVPIPESPSEPGALTSIDMRPGPVAKRRREMKVREEMEAMRG